MFAIALRHPLRASVTRQTRSLVSSVLLSRTWENETIAELKKEAKNRGLSTKGNKASLISRIQEHEKLSVLGEVGSQTPPPLSSRSASTSATSAVEGEAPGKPSYPDVQMPSDDFFKVIIPDVSEPEPEPPIQIPYVPDLWNSSQVTESAAAEENHLEPVLPKLVVVAGAGTHPGGGPSHNLLEANLPPADSQPPEAPAPSNAEQGFWQDVAEDMGLKGLGKSFSKLFY